MTARLLCCTLAIGAAGCAAAPATPSPFAFVLGVIRVTSAFEYRAAANDQIDIDRQEAYHTWATAALDLTMTRRIRYNKYHSREHMAQVIGVGNTNGFADADSFDIHTIWGYDNHEVVHLYSSLFGRPVALWTEGLAVAHQTNPAGGDLVPRWSGTPLDSLARQFRSDGRLIPIAELLSTAGFRRFDANVTYPEAGSFVRFILDTCGLAGVKQLYRAGSPDDSADRVAADFQTICGRSIAAAEQMWLAMLAPR